MRSLEPSGNTGVKCSEPASAGGENQVPNMSPHPPASGRTPPRERPPSTKTLIKTPPRESFTTLRFACETTGDLITYEVPNDVRTVRDLWSRSIRLSCRHCGDVHSLAFRTGFIRGALELGSDNWHPDLRATPRPRLST